MGFKFCEKPKEKNAKLKHNWKILFIISSIKNCIIQKN